MGSRMTKTKRVVLLQPASTGGNFEYIAIPRQGMLFLSGALGQWEGAFHYEREIWFEDRSAAPSTPTRTWTVPTFSWSPP